MFRTQAIIIHKQKIRDGQTRVILFTRDYGMVTGWEKKNQIPDLGSIVEASIERIGGLNKIKQLDIHGIISQESWKYEEALGFLHILQTLYELLPDSSPHISIFDDMESLIRLQNSNIGKFQLFILIHMRILKKLGTLKSEGFLGDSVLSYIYKNIDIRNIKSVLQCKPLTPSNLSYIQGSILEARHKILTGA